MENEVQTKWSKEDIGLLILRLSLGGLMLFHGVAKMQSGPQGLMDMLDSKGIPGFVAFGAYIGEVLAPLLMVIGVFTRPAAAVFAFNMVVAIALAHSADIVALNPKTGGMALEMQYLYLFGSIALAFTGPGRLSVMKPSKWN